MKRTIILMILMLEIVLFAQTTIDNDYFTINLSNSWQLLDRNRSCVWKSFPTKIYQTIKKDLDEILDKEEFDCRQLVKYSDKYDLLFFTVKLKKKLEIQFDLLYTEDRSYKATGLPAFEYSDLSIPSAYGAYIFIDPPVGLLYKFFILFPKEYHGSLRANFNMVVFSKKYPGLVEYSKHYILTLTSDKKSLEELIFIYEHEIERLKKILGE